MAQQKDPTCRRIMVPLCLMILAIACSCRTSAPVRIENVLFILVDTLRADRVSSYGYPRATAPNVDALAAQGIVFSRAYATSPWTKPSLASMITGLYPSSHSVQTITAALPESVDTLAEILKEEGFRTAGYVSSQIINDYHYAFGQGYETYHGSHGKGHNYASTPGVTRQALRSLEEFAEDQQRFFLFVHYFDPHYNYLRHSEFGMAAGRQGKLDGSQSIQELRGLLPDLSREEISFLMDLYDEEIRFTDLGIGRLLHALRRLNLDDKTLVVLVGDHGEEFGEHGWLGHTRTLYEELIRVPLIMKIPGDSRSQTVSDSLISLVSLTPTVLDLLDVSYSSRVFQGSSILNVNPDRDKTGQRTVFVEVAFTPEEGVPIERAHKKGVVGERFKLIRDEDSGTMEVYDLFGDGLEMHSLKQGNPPVFNDLKQHLESWIAKVGSIENSPVRHAPTEDEIEALRGLGYVGS